MSKSIVAVILFMSSTLVQAGQVYKWTDAKGTTHYSSSVAPETKTRILDYVEPKLKTSEDKSVGEKAANANETSTKKTEADMKKNQNETSPAKKTQVEEEQKNCKMAKENQKLLESGTRVSITNAKGEKEILDDAAKQLEIKKSIQAVADWCSAK